ncbi:MAG: RdgB/HAM1 family non-canonical purine NTP pyrophosphatase [Ruminococcus sp.]|nr:RdgB/HAM1 family non-canonical purine NTP pyrophosphatase [Ruminococcus sp.]
MIEKLVMATNNANKLREAREILAPLGIEVISQREAGADVEADENGESFEENAVIKAQTVYDIVGLPVIADDSGLCVDALGGRPGVHSARYAPKGEECDKLLEELKDVPEDERSARFECWLVFMDYECLDVVTGSCEGRISTEKRGDNGFGYDPVFLYGSRTLAEMSADEKNAISHRGAALRALYDLLKERYGE